MKTILLIFASCVLFTNSVFAQNHTQVNSIQVKDLQQQLHRAVSDTAKTRLATKISTLYRSASEYDSCKKYAAIAINFTKNFPLLKSSSAQDLNYKKLRAKAMENFGAALSYEDVTPALVALHGALRLWKETGDKAGIAMTSFTLGEAYSNQSDQITAIDYYTKSLKLFEETHNRFYVAQALTNISLEKRGLGMYGDALEFSIKSLKVAEEIKDTFLITDALLANSFNYMLAKQYTNAHLEQKKALKLFRKSKDLAGIARVYNDMGVTDMFANKLDDALKNHKMALQMRKQLNDANTISITYNYIAGVYRKQRKLKEALAASKAGVPYALKFGDSRFVGDTYLETGDIYAELKDYENALANYNLANEVGKKNRAKNIQAHALLQSGIALKQAGDLRKALTFLTKAEKTVSNSDYKVRKNIYSALAATYVQNNNYKNGYENQLKFQQMSDSVNATEKAEKITALTQKLIYENKRDLQAASQGKEIAIKEAQIAKQKLIRNLSITGLLIGAALAILFFIRLKEKRELNIALEQTVINLKATQTQLIHAEKMASLGELTAGIAHEIQNPLNFVNNFAEISNEMIEEIKEERKKKKEERDEDFEYDLLENISNNLEKINHHGKRADDIVKGMLQHSRTSSGTKEPTDLNALCDEYLRLSYHGLRAKDKSFNATIHSDFDPAIGSIDLFAQDFGRVILNLLTNAFYVVNEKKLLLGTNFNPTVSISTKKEKHQIKITVSDNGSGIPRDIVDKIFQPFFTTKPSGKGTGLGLSLSYDIVKKHGGQLKVETKNGEGTQFIIELPRKL